MPRQMDIMPQKRQRRRATVKNIRSQIMAMKKMTPSRIMRISIREQRLMVACPKRFHSVFQGISEDERGEKYDSKQGIDDIRQNGLMRSSSCVTLVLFVRIPVEGEFCAIDIDKHSINKEMDAKLETSWNFDQQRHTIVRFEFLQNMNPKQMMPTTTTKTLNNTIQRTSIHQQKRRKKCLP